MVWNVHCRSIATFFLEALGCTRYAVAWSVHPIVLVELQHHAGNQYDKKASLWVGPWRFGADGF
jgi:hypothetical protein